jgi:hypothetical protein
MTKTAAIITQLEQIGAGIVDAKAVAGEALERAVELTEEAVGHGWDGVATCMQGCRDALEAVIASVGTAEDDVGESVSALRAITEQMSRPEVADHLGQAINHVDQVRAAVESADGSTDDARQAAEQAGSPESLMSMLQGVTDTINAARRGLAAVKSAAQGEQQQAAAWGN